MSLKEIRVMYEDADEQIPFGANIIVDGGRWEWLGGRHIDFYKESTIDIGRDAFTESHALPTPEPTLAEVVEFVKAHV